MDSDLTLDVAIQDVCDERARQDAKWGGPDHDDGHDSQDWAQFIEYQTHAIPYEANLAIDREEYDAIVRRRFVKVAALAVAALQSIDRKQAALKENQ